MRIGWILLGLSIVGLSACSSEPKTTPRGSGGMGGELASSSSGSSLTSSSGAMGGMGGANGVGGSGNAGSSGNGGGGGNGGAGGGAGADVCTNGGKLVWARALTDQTNLAAGLTAYDVKTAADGSFVLGGHLNGTHTFGANTPYSTQLTGYTQSPMLMRLADDGSFRWAAVYHPMGYSSVQYVRPLPDGSILAVGDFSGQVTFDMGLPTEITLNASDGVSDTDIFLVRVGPDGLVQWAKNYGVAGTQVPYGMGVRSDGRIVMAGRFGKTITFNPGEPDEIVLTRPAGYFLDNFLVLLDEKGHALWARASGGTSSNDGIRGMAVLPDDSVAITAEFKGNITFDDPVNPVTLNTPVEFSAYVAHYKNDGTFDWARMVEGKSIGYNVAQDSAGRIVFSGAGESMNVFGTGEPSQTMFSGGNFVARYLANGNFLDVFRSGATQVEEDMLLTPGGHVATVGTWANAVTFAFANGDEKFTTGLFTNSYLACSGSPSVVHWARLVTGTQHEFARAMTLASNGDIVVVGNFSETMSIDSGGPDPVLLPNGMLVGQNSFLLRYGQ